MGSTISSFNSDNTVSYVERSMVSLKENFTFANASEDFYKYIGKNSVRPFPALIHEDDRDTFLNAVSMLHNGKESLIVRIMNHAGDYRQFHIVMSYNEKIINGFESIDMLLTDLSPLGESMSSRKEYSNVLEEIKSRGEERYYFKEDSIDVISKVYDRKAITEVLDDVFDNIDDEYPVYIVMLDIDEFKIWNDTYGHSVGDRIIGIVGSTIRRVIGKRGYVGRFGGDEFVIVLNRVKTDEDVIFMFKTIRNNVAWESGNLGFDMPLTLSLGLSSYPKDADNLQDLLEISDKCLYIAKAKGRNRFIRYEKEKHESFDLKKNRITSSRILTNNNYLMCMSVNKFFAAIRNNGEAGLCDALDDLRVEYDLDGISVFGGNNYERWFTSGNYESPINNVSFIDSPDMQVLFDAYGVFSTNKIITLKESCSEAYDALMKQGNSGVIMIKFTDEEKNIVVSFDIFGRNRKWSDVDKGLLLIIANAIYNAGKRDFE